MVAYMGLLLIKSAIYYCMRRRYSDLTEQEKDDIFLHGIERFQNRTMADGMSALACTILTFIEHLSTPNTIDYGNLETEAQNEIFQRLQSIGLI